MITTEEKTDLPPNSNGILAPLEQILRTPLDNYNQQREDGLFNEMRKNGAEDKVLLWHIGNAFNSCSSLDKRISWKGGKNPKFQMETGPCQVTALTGKRLLAKVREVLGIGAPGAIVETPSVTEKKRLHKEALARFRGESEKLPDSPKCVCGETLAQHDAHAGACGLADCGCEGFAPADLVDATTETPAESNGYHPRMLRMIPLDQIVPSPTNPRKHFDQDKLKELANSIIEHGLVEPILVRPLRETTTGALVGGDISETLEAWPGLADNLYYEIVAGERRWRAVKLAGQTQIEAKVRDLDDRSVLEIQFIENLQRADLSPIEEAGGYKRLLDEHGYTADSLAGKLGKSKSYVYGRLKLCNLPPLALQALSGGDLPATTAELIGRLPSMEMREEFWEDNYHDIGSEWFQAPSFRDVKTEIERHYMRELKSAPFSQADKKLDPEAGSCKDCPKRTGNDRANYPDGRADICTDVPCYERKVEAHLAREVEKAKESGAKVLSASESAKLFNNAGDSSWLKFDAERKYVDLAAQPYGDEQKRSYKQLLAGHLEPVVAIDSQGKAHYLAPRAEAEKVLKEIHGIKSETRSAMSDYKASEKKRQDEKKLRQAAAAEIVERALQDVDDEIFHSTFLRVMAKFLIDHGDADVARAIAKRREIQYDQAHVRGSVTKIVDGLRIGDVPGLVVEWLLQRELEYWAQWGSRDEFILCDYFGLKPSAVLKEVSAKLKAEAKEAKKQPKSKVKAGATA